MFAPLYSWLTRFLKALRPPSGPRYELVDTAAAIAWIATVAYVIYPAPAASSKAVGAPVEIVSEQHLGIIIGVAMLVSIALSYIPVRVFEFRGQPRIVYPVKIGYQIARTATLFMALNFLVTVVTLLADLYLPQNVPSFLHSVPPIPVDNAESTLRAALIYLMVYGYAFRRLKRDNRVVHKA